MKKILIGVFLSLCLVFFILFFQVFKSDTLEYKLNNKTYRLLVADEEKEFMEGLMYRKKLDKADGMIFLFNSKERRTFWNKNTLIDLDVYWLNDENIVGKDFLPSIEKTKAIYSITSPKPVNKVIELVR